MNSQRGLLLLLCVMVLLLAVLFGVPLFSAGERLSWLAEGVPWEGNLLQYSLRLAGSEKVFAHERQALLWEVAREHRPDEKITRLAAAHKLTFAELKAFLAAVSRGSADQEGMFWLGPEQVQSANAVGALQRCDEAAGKISRLKTSTGSWTAALLGWVVGQQRAERLARLMHRRQDPRAAVRIFLPATLREGALGFFCQAEILRLGLDSVWPVKQGGGRESEGGLEWENSGGQEVLLPLPGRIEMWAAGCALVDHGCGLRSQFCGLSSAAAPGENLLAGARVGLSAGTVKWKLFLGGRPIDPQVLAPP